MSCGLFTILQKLIRKTPNLRDRNFINSFLILNFKLADMKSFIILLVLTLAPMGSYAQFYEAPANSRFYYNGSIVKLDNIQMNLHIDGYVISGAMVMESTGAQFMVEGRMSKEKDGIGIRIYDSYNKYIASIEANIISEEKNFAKKIRGVYKPGDTTERYLLSINKIAEFASSGKPKNTSFVSIL